MRVMVLVKASPGSEAGSLPSEQLMMDRIFHALAEGGTVDMPLGPTFWSPLYGMVTDKFNVGWMVMVAADQS